MASEIFHAKDKLSYLDDYTEAYIEEKPEELVLMNHLKRSYPGIKSPKGWKRTNELAGRQRKSYTAVAEGTDKKDGWAFRKNALIESQLEVGYSDGYAVTRQAVVLSGGRIPEDVLKRKITQDGQDFARSLEHILGSRQECMPQETTATVTKTRGLMCWLQHEAHSKLDVPADLRPVAELKLTGDAALTEDAFKEQLRLARNNARHMLYLTGFVGIDAKLAFSEFLGKVQTVTGYENTLRRTTDYRNTTVFQSVDFLKYDTANVTLITLDGLDCDTSTLEPGTYSGHSGAFVELDNFQLEFAEPITHEDLSDKLDLGSGRKGFHHAMFRLNCTGLLGSFRMIRVAASTGD